MESEAESDSDVEMDEAAQVAQAKAMAAAVKAKPTESKGKVARHTPPKSTGLTSENHAMSLWDPQYWEGNPMTLLTPPADPRHSATSRHQQTQCKYV